MDERQMSGRELVEEWVIEKLVTGRTIDEMDGTAFIYGNEILTLKKNEDGALDCKPQKVPGLVVLPKREEDNICSACGSDHPSYKAVLECCADVE